MLSSSRTKNGVGHPRTNSRVTVKTKSASDRYILCRNASTVVIVRSGLRAHSAGPQPLNVVLVEEVGQFRTKAARLCQHGGKARLGARRKKFHMKGPPMQKPITRNLSIPK
jgi:hypothetical protein